MHLFSSRTRPDQGPARRCESQFSYLERSGRPEADRVRALIEDWLAYYPTSQRGRLVGNLRSSNDAEHLGAFLELVVYEIFRKEGASIQVEPSLQNSIRTPDFLINLDGVEFYVEATSGFEVDSNYKSFKPLYHVLDEIDKIDSDLFFIGVEHSGVPARSLSGKMVRQIVRIWLDSLNYEEVLQAWQSHQWEQFEHNLEIDGARLVLTPFPKQPVGSGADRLIGIEMPEARYVSTVDVVRRRLIDKAKRYGQLNKPYFVVVNLFGLAPDRGDVLDALFGTRAASVTWHSDGPQVARMVRLPDGVWFRGTASRHTRLTGVIWTQGLSPWSLAARTLELIHNPAASLPLPSIGLPVPTLVPRGDRLELEPGRNVGELLGLPAGWPEA